MFVAPSCRSLPIMPTFQEELARMFDEDPDAGQPLTMSPTPDRFVCLVSSDEHRFYIPWVNAMQCKTIVRMAEFPHGGEEDGEAIPEYRLIGITSSVLHIVCRYLRYKMVYRNCVLVEDGNVSALELGEFHIPENFLIPVMLAANFLDC
ncbi:hypothetical protein L596_012857 [Steinernema carpocapsae]|uniref:Elongin-C n=1 Tax=Steinernema carpocapsae TaxID=34508 RepID=A0A4U5NYC3_STECR|nr:hypothetical protein L596_012857 [Steinernema carpocapsae]